MARTIPVSSTQAPGNFITGALWNAGPAASNTFLTTVPMVQVYQGTVQTIATGSFTAITFDSTTIDTDTQHSNSTNNSRFTCQIAGWYECSGAVGMVANGTGNRDGFWAKNGSALTAPGPGSVIGGSGAYGVAIALPTIYQFLNAGDYMEIWVFQNSGGNLNTTTGQFGNSMSIKWIHS